MPRITMPEDTIRTVTRSYREGYDTGKTMYQDKPLRDLVYGYEHYARAGTLKHGAYERGIADALAERINAARKQS